MSLDEVVAAAEIAAVVVKAGIGEIGRRVTTLVEAGIVDATLLEVGIVGARSWVVIVVIDDRLRDARLGPKAAAITGRAEATVTAMAAKQGFDALE